MSITETCIKNPVFTIMIVLGLVVFGAISYTRIGLDSLPDIDPPVATVTCVYPGGDPETIEKEISKRIEDAVSQIAGIKTLRSMSLNNVSITTVEFELNVSTNQAVQDVRDKVNSILSELPSDAKVPVVARFDPGSWPILTLTISGQVPISQLTQFVREQVRDPLQALNGVGSIDIVGGQEREIQVEIDPQKLRAHHLAIGDVVNLLKASNLDFPGGSLKENGRERSVKLVGRYESVAALANTKLLDVGGQPVLLADVAHVTDGVEEQETVARLGKTNAVMLQVRKQSGANTLEVGEKVKKRLDELASSFPQGFKAEVSVDSTKFIRESFESVRFDIIFGAFLAVFIVLLFLRNFRSTLIAAIAIPSSLLGTFIFMNAFHFTFNMITLVALSLSIGMLIDDAIVILENIYRHIELGSDPMKAAREATKEIALAVMATTFTIVAVFVPVAFMEGMVGRMFFQFGLTVSFAVLLSLFISFSLTPMLCSRHLKVIEETKVNLVFRLSGYVLDGIDRIYRRIIAWALNHKAATVTIAVLTLLVSFGAARLIEFTLSPTPDTSQINLTVKMPQGTTLEKTDRYAQDIIDLLLKEPNVIQTVTTIGADQQKRVYEATITVKLKEKDERKEKLNDIVVDFRRKLAVFKDVTILVAPRGLFDTGMEGTSSDQVQFDFRGKDLDRVDAYTQQFMRAVRSDPVFADVESTYEKGKPELKVKIERDKMTRLGVTAAAAGMTMNMLVGGVDATKYREGGDDYTIRVRLSREDRARGEQLGELQVRNSNGTLVDLASFSRNEPGTGPTRIDREARMRQISLRARLAANQTMGVGIAHMQALTEKMAHPGIQANTGGMSKIMGESFASMFTALFIGIFVVYMILASQFNSYIHPFTIMLALPLSLPGAFGALLLAHEPMSIFTMIGLIMLMGLVTKNAILLVDYTNTLRTRDGFGRTEALLQAGSTRLRPILMTTLAMVFGMLPIAVSTGYGAEVRAGMAIVVIGGLFVSTLLTLVVVPVIYSMLDAFSERIRQRRV